MLIKNTSDSRDVDDYLAGLPHEARITLTNLRNAIKRIVPNATEVISYQVPTFKYNGSLVAYAAFPKHFSFFVMSTDVMNKYKNELKSYDTSKGTIRFTIDKPLTLSLVKKIVKSRMVENEGKAFKSEKSKKGKRKG